jgi:hypothetical protein
MFGDFSTQRVQNERGRDKTTREAAKIIKRSGDAGSTFGRPRCFEDVMSPCFLDHFRSVVRAGVFLSLGDLPNGEAGPTFQSTGATLSGKVVCARSDDPPELELSADLDAADNVQPDGGGYDPMDVANKVFFRVVHSHPRCMKTVRIPHAAGGRIS